MTESVGMQLDDDSLLALFSRVRRESLLRIRRDFAMYYTGVHNAT